MLSEVPVTKRPSARFGRSAVVGAVLALSACASTTTPEPPCEVQDGGGVDVTPLPPAQFLVRRNNGGTPTGDDARLVAALCLAQQLPGAWTCEQSDLSGASCHGVDEAEVVELADCAVQTTAGALVTTAILRERVCAHELTAVTVEGEARLRDDVAEDCIQELRPLICVLKMVGLPLCGRTIASREACGFLTVGRDYDCATPVDVARRSRSHGATLLTVENPCS